MMDLELFMELAESYNRLGGAVQGQLQSIMRGEPKEEQNSNALRMIVSWLGGAADDLEGAGELAEQLEKYLDAGDYGEFGI